MRALLRCYHRDTLRTSHMLTALCEITLGFKAFGMIHHAVLIFMRFF